MSVSVCPVAIVQAPPERVWGLLSEPANYALWWDAQTRAVIPAGPAQAGQKIYARARGLRVEVTVNAVDESGHQLDLTTQLPLGITVFNHIACRALPDRATQVSFG